MQLSALRGKRTKAMNRARRLDADYQARDNTRPDYAIRYHVNAARRANRQIVAQLRLVRTAHLNCDGSERS